MNSRGYGVFVAVVVMSALLATSASATQWLKGGEPITTATAASGEGTIVLTKTGGTLGSGEVRCNGSGKGTVGPGATGEVTEVTNLSGTEKSLVACERLSGFCFSPVVHAESLPQKGELVLEGGLTWAKGKGALQFLCAIGSVLCSGEGKAKFVKNVASGAEFASAGAESGQATCSDGGIVTVTGKGTVLGVAVS